MWRPVRCTGGLLIFNPNRSFCIYTVCLYSLSKAAYYLWRVVTFLLSFYFYFFKKKVVLCLSCCRYIYVPLGGSRRGPLHRLLSTAFAFGFVCFWHGGHDYLQCWALMNWAGVLVENGLKSLLASSFIRSIVVSVKATYLWSDSTKTSW